MARLDVDRPMEELFGSDRGLPEYEGNRIEIAALEALPHNGTVPGQGYRIAWGHVRLRIEQEPGGTWYRGHHVAWVVGAQPGEWLHEVDGDADHRFVTLIQALIFIDVLES